ncbi:hypothetical protein OG765_29115 [Streptomyces sp. NBC_00555]|uniref:hypothetical protein n=1 Tax=Streptomyces sp. NBC_00555 TaxID=2903662 RepID=UPI002256012B|nr:hypothetical protein [Streptomyces sp. NBC_00555]MCX5015000.1 hypothetical protein [Streptomyces sp. NBC_00555]
MANPLDFVNATITRLVHIVKRTKRGLQGRCPSNPVPSSPASSIDFSSQQAAEVAVSWVLAGELTHEQVVQLIVRDHSSSHSWMAEAEWLHRWERNLRDALTSATDSEEGRQRAATAKVTALREIPGSAGLDQ